MPNEIYWTLIDLANGILAGTLLGGYYAVISLGLALSFGVMKQVNLAQGDWLIVASYLIVGLFVSLGVWPVLAIAIIVPVMFVIGYLMQALLLNRVSVQSMEQKGLPTTFGMMSPVLATFGVSIILSRGLQLSFGSDPKSIQTSLSFQSIRITDDLQISALRLIFFVLAVCLLVGMHFFLQKSRMGRALRAVSQDIEISKVMGMQPNKVFAIANGIAMATAAFAGGMIGMSRTFQPFDGPQFLLMAFGVCVVGGIGSMMGILVGGILLGIVQILAGTYFTSAAQLIAGYVFVLGVLSFRTKEH